MSSFNLYIWLVMLVFHQTWYNGSPSYWTMHPKFLTSHMLLRVVRIQLNGRYCGHKKIASNHNNANWIKLISYWKLSHLLLNTWKTFWRSLTCILRTASLDQTYIVGTYLMGISGILNHYTICLYQRRFLKCTHCVVTIHTFWVNEARISNSHQVIKKFIWLIDFAEFELKNIDGQ